jgi:hypothetical protein
MLFLKYFYVTVIYGFHVSYKCGYIHPTEILI